MDDVKRINLHTATPYWSNYNIYSLLRKTPSIQVKTLLMQDTGIQENPTRSDWLYGLHFQVHCLYDSDSVGSMIGIQRLTFFVIQIQI